MAIKTKKPAPRPLAVEEWPLEKIIPYERNARNIPQSAIDKVAASLMEYGWQQPIVVDRKGVIVAGHTRRLAALKLGWTVAPVLVAGHLTAAQIKAYRLMDNRSHQEATWDDKLLGIELNDLKALDFDLAKTGFEKIELDGLFTRITSVEEGLTDPDDVPEARPEPDAKPGDVWILGNHRLMCGDSTIIGDVEKLMDGEKAHMVFTDPPYGVGYDGGTTPREKLAGDDNTALYEPACTMAFFFSDEHAPLYLWHAGVKGIAAAAAAAAAAAGYAIRCEIVWNKNLAQFGSLSSQYKQKHEPAYYCYRRGSTVRWYGPTNEVTVWDISRASQNEYHPTQKPVALAERAINNSSETAHIVLDLFGGSGSTLIACEKTARRARLMELSPAYCDVIVRRWEAFTGKKAGRA